MLANASALLESLAASGPLSVSELAQQLGIPRPSTYRLVEGLVDVGLVQDAGDSRIELGLRWLHLADAARDASIDDWGGVRSTLDHIASATGFTAYFSLLRKHRAFFLDWSLGTGLGVLELHPGGRLDLNLGGAGRALLAFGPEGTERYLDVIEPRASTRFSLVSREDLLADAEATRRRGYALSLDDVTIGAGAIGVPVTDHRGEVTAVVSAAGLSADVAERAEELAEVVREATQALSPPSVTS